jgi:hypothetical protein
VSALVAAFSPTYNRRNQVSVDKARDLGGGGRGVAGDGGGLGRFDGGGRGMLRVDTSPSCRGTYC